MHGPMRYELPASGAPGVNVTAVLAEAAPSVAVTVFTSAVVERKVQVNTPDPLVLPLVLLNVLSLPVDEIVTAWPEITLLLTSRAVMVSVVVVAPSASRLATLGSTVEVAELTAPAVNVTAVVWVTVTTPLMVAVMVLASAWVDLMVAVH